MGLRVQDGVAETDMPEVHEMWRRLPSAGQGKVIRNGGDAARRGVMSAIQIG